MMQALNVNVKPVNQTVQNQQAYAQAANQLLAESKKQQSTVAESQKQTNYSRMFEAFSDCV